MFDWVGADRKIRSQQQTAYPKRASFGPTTGIFPFIGGDAVALYRFVASIDTVFVVAVRSQREVNYKLDL